MQENLQQFSARGASVAAISVDGPEVNRKHCQKQGYTYTFLSDPKAEVIRRYGVLHPRGGREATDVARPAEFLIDPEGAIRWVNFTEDYRVRARAEQILKVMDELRPARR